MNTDTIIQNTFGQVMSNAAQAMSEAVKQYGPDAVDLGLIVYRISALQQILLGVVALIGIFVSKHFMQVFYKKSVDEAQEWFLAAFLLMFILIFCLISTINCLFNVYAWAALSGHPEILIAYKALVAAGLM